MKRNILSIPHGLRLAMCGVWDKARRHKNEIEATDQPTAEPVPTTQLPETDVAAEAAKTVAAAAAEPVVEEIAPTVEVAAASVEEVEEVTAVIVEPRASEPEIAAVPEPASELDAAFTEDTATAREPESAEAVLEPAAEVVDTVETADVAETGAEPADAPQHVEAKTTPAKRVPRQAGEMSPTARRREIAEELLATVGRTRPIVARDVAEAFGSGVDRSQRESARTALNRMVTAGIAVRLPDGSFVPADRSAAGEP